jgi:steroid delta-isomerase-like uncharacterized protein
MRRPPAASDVRWARVRHGHAKERIAATRDAFPDFETRIDGILSDGPRGVVLWTASGTHRGPLLGMPPTGRRLEWSGMTWFVCDGERLAEEWELFDRTAVVEQLA